MVSIIIPTYSHTETLLKNLRHNIRFFRDTDEIIVVNDNPKRDLKPYFQEFPHIILIEHTTNTGFGTAVNDGVKMAHYPILMLINDDVLFHDSSYLTAVEQLHADQNIFAVSFAQKQINGTIVGKNSIFWHQGLPMHHGATSAHTSKTAWAEGGAAVFDKTKWNILNGFSPIYNPFYWEDIDLSFRAWKMGFQIQFNEHVVVEHNHESTIGSVFSKNRISEIAFRNQFLFTWNNITDTRLMLSHLFWLPFNMVYYGIYKRQFFFIIGFCKAAIYTLQHGFVKKKVQYKKSDTQIFDMFL